MSPSEEESASQETEQEANDDVKPSPLKEESISMISSVLMAEIENLNHDAFKTTEEIKVCSVIDKLCR